MSANKTKGIAQSRRKSLRQKLRVKSDFFRIFMAEFLGTFLLMVFVLGCIAQTTFGARTKDGYGGFFGGFVGGGVAVSLGMYAALSTSGGHVNPAITLAAWVIGMVKWTRIPFYWMGQYLGSFVAAVCIFGVYNDALYNYDGGNRTITGPNATAGIFATYPKDFVSIGTAMGDSILATALLVIGALSILDPQNNNTEQGLIPLAVGMAVMAITFAYNLNISTGINPARDLSPRIFTAIAGWGTGVFSYNGYKWFWIPIVAPHIGGIGGALTYQLCIAAHHPDIQVKETDNVSKKPMDFEEIQNIYHVEATFEQNRFIRRTSL